MKRILSDREINVANKLRGDGYKVREIANMFDVSEYVIETATNASVRARKLAYNRGYYAGKRKASANI